MTLFNRVDTARVGYSTFNLSHRKMFTADMGWIYPVAQFEVIPGDRLFIGFETIARMLPSIAPVLQAINIRVNYFFCPYRLLWPQPSGFEDFITGGEDGTAAPTWPTWSPGATAVGDLWDHFGFGLVTPDADNRPSDMLRRAYARIFNEYYRPEEIYAEIAETNEAVMETTWAKDYFLGAQVAQLRGTPPAIPINGNPNLSFAAFTTANQTNMYYNSAIPAPYDAGVKAFLETGTVDMSTGASIDVAEVRTALRIQEWMERNQRAGARYFEQLQSHYNISGNLDMRLDRMEFIGGAKSPVIISEILQTSETNTTPQGTLAGHGIAVDKNFIGKYTVKEHGLVMGLMTIMPDNAYPSKGINRQWFKSTKYDFYFPEFANLSEQAILERELVISNTKSENETVYGYTGCWDHYRQIPDYVCGKMRPGQSLDHWHLAKEWAGRPALNWTFLKAGVTVDKDFLAAPSEDTFMINHGNIIKAIRPLPVIAVPSILGA